MHTIKKALSKFHSPPGGYAMKQAQSTSPKNKRDLLVKIAKLYYYEGLSQQQIADRLFMSRSNVSMLLKSCEDNGVVVIRIVDSESKAVDMAARIKDKYSLQDIQIATSHSDPEITQDNAGALAAAYLERHLETGMKFGFSSGRINLNIISHLDFSDFVKVDSVALSGCLSGKYSKYGNIEIAHSFMSKLHGDAYTVNAPMMVQSKALKTLLLQELDVALLAIGTAKFPHRMAMHDGQLSSADVLQLIEMKAEAVICGRYFDIQGSPCNAGINERILAIDLETLKRIPLRIGVAVGSERASAVKSILRSGYVNALIVDEFLARCLI